MLEHEKEEQNMLINAIPEYKKTAEIAKKYLNY